MSNTGNKIKSFEDLIVWQKAIKLSVEVYKLTSKFPKDETFGLTSQIRKASDSISLNISEGSVRTTKPFINHLRIANGSASEVFSAAILAKELDFFSAVELDRLRNQTSEIKKILNTLISSLERKTRVAGSELNTNP